MAQAYWVALVAAVSLPAPAYLPLFAAGAALELAVPAIAQQTGATGWHQAHIVARYGRLTSIVLGQRFITVVAALQDVADSAAARTGIRVISIPDMRWGRRDIKTVQLLYPSMGKMMAKKAGPDDAWMIEDGHVTEGTSNNAYIVKGDTIVTRHLSNDILHGITRAAVLRFAREAQMKVEERHFTIDEAKAADEAFVTSASTFVMPVVQVDEAVLGDGTPGPVSRRLREIYVEESRKTAV